MAASAWHWRTLGVRDWAQTWLSEQLVNLEADGVRVTKVSSVEGDCELGSRKGKLLTIYDLRVELEWEGKDSKGEKVAGRLVVPELEHDMDEDAYQFESTVTTGSGADADKARQTARTRLADLVRPKFTAFPKAMIDTHGKTLRAQNEASPSGSGTSTPSGAVKSSGAAVQLPGVESTAGKGVVNTSVVRASADFMSAADDLFDLLTNQDKVPLWSRNPAKIRPEKGAEVALFNGNITGEVIEVDRPNKFVTTWRAPTWPSGHFGHLHTTLTQGSDSTTLELRLTGVPRGEEETTERNLDVFYIRSLKAIGYGDFLRPRRPASRAPGVARPFKGWLHVVAANVAPVLLSLSLVLGLGLAIYYGPTGET